MAQPEDLLLWGIIAHLIADWPLQTDWMAVNKANLSHPAAWAHSGVHALFMLFIFPWYLALLIAMSHLLIDTRVPVRWWMRVIKGTGRETPNRFMLETGLDQVFHIAVLASVVLIFY